MRRHALFGRLERSARDECGAVLVIVAIVLPFILFGFAAIAIDVGTFSQQQRQAQAAADAAALAGAQDLPGSASNATSDAQTYASTNMPGLPYTCGATPGICVVAPYNSNTKQIQVTVTENVPSLFGRIFGINSTNVSATAVAQNTTQSTACSTPGNGCYAIFASDSNCGTSSSPNYSVTFNGSGNTITGGVHSNGSIDLVGGSQSLGPTTYGSGSNCKLTAGGTGDTYSSGPTPQAAITSWPDDYSTILTACGGAGQVACSGPNGTPSYCTKAQTSFDFPTDAIATGNVYCAYGTGIGVNVKDPATWTGLIYFHSGSFGSSGSPIYGTWIGGTIEVGRPSYLAPQTTTPTYPVFYAAGSGDCSSASSGGICMTASSSQVSGAMFAPKGTIQFSGAGSTANFLESKDVTLVGGSFTGNGPLDSGTGTTGSSGSDALVQ